ncbi:Kunitz protease inhibitor [Echinococcus multilocularis]|uniref:Kunitz protease inhibitor n=1 Tax=Echinococcus multilocularis TaxID=6211 RepID=A0A068YNL9_ECHMU|nr:Kunitz protease inhibitor [Echinococcus multilocularis]
MTNLALLLLMLLGVASFSQGNEDICSLPIEVGPCRSRIRAWGFNPKTGQCINFVYGGCGGNANRFKHRRACERACLKSSPSTKD